MNTKVLLDPMMEGYLRIRVMRSTNPRICGDSRSPTPVDTGADNGEVRLGGQTESFVLASRVAAFANLKQRLLLQFLDSVDDHARHNLIINEANTTARIASTTGFPLLVYPCLFDERASEALTRDEWRSSIYWRRLRSM